MGKSDSKNDGKSEYITAIGMLANAISGGVGKKATPGVRSANEIDLTNSPAMPAAKNSVVNVAWSPFYVTFDHVFEGDRDNIMSTFSVDISPNPTITWGELKRESPVGRFDGIFSCLEDELTKLQEKKAFFCFCWIPWLQINSVCSRASTYDKESFRFR